MGSILKAREEAIKLANKPLVQNKSNFGEYDSIYMAPTSNVKGLLSLYNNYESVLAVGATGAIGYEAALHGAKKIDLFDINELQQAFYEYMQTAIMIFEYEDFIKHFTLKSQSRMMKVEDLKDLLSDECYYKLRPFLTERAELILGELFDRTSHIKLLQSSLFKFEQAMYIDYLRKYVSFYNKEDYYKLQRILREKLCEFSYHAVSIRQVPYEFDSKYDLILFDNVLQYYKEIPGLNNSNRVNMFIDKQIAPMLNDNGKIQVNYGFTIASEAVKKYYGLPGSKNMFYTNPWGQMEIQKDVKEGIDVQLLRKWDHYSYDFIDAVEENEGFTDTNNVVITYQKR